MENRYCKYYKYAIIIVLSINILLMLINNILDITLYYDVYTRLLWVVLVVMIMMYPYEVSCFTLVCKFIGIVGGIIAIVIVLWFNSYVQYGAVDSPNHTNHAILKGTSEGGLHHRYYSVEVYERIGGIFKRDMGKRIYEYDIPLFVREPMFEITPNSYKIDYRLYLEWLSEDILHMYIDKEKEREVEVLDITINFNE